MTELLFGWDEALLRQINTTWTSPALDKLMGTVSHPEYFYPVMAAAVVGLVIWGKVRGRLLVVLIALALLIGDAGINWAIKRSVNRPRPHQALEGIRVVSHDGVRWSQPGPVEKGRSFTSGHVCNNVALAIMATLTFGWRWAWWLWPWAGLVAYSRIYNGAHYPSDVFGSILVATVYSVLIWSAVRAVWQRWLPWEWPRSRLQSCFLGATKG